MLYDVTQQLSKKKTYIRPRLTTSSKKLSNHGTFIFDDHSRVTVYIRLPSVKAAVHPRWFVCSICSRDDCTKCQGHNFPFYPEFVCVCVCSFFFSSQSPIFCCTPSGNMWVKLSLFRGRSSWGNIKPYCCYVTVSVFIYVRTIYWSTCERERMGQIWNEQFFYCYYSPPSHDSKQIRGINPFSFARRDNINGNECCITVSHNDAAVT